MQSDGEIIDELGGNTALGRFLGISDAAVCMWRKNGIPKLRRIQIASELFKRGHAVPAGLIEPTAGVEEKRPADTAA